MPVVDVPDGRAKQFPASEGGVALQVPAQGIEEQNGGFEPSNGGNGGCGRSCGMWLLWWLRPRLWQPAAVATAAFRTAAVLSSHFLASVPLLPLLLASLSAGIVGSTGLRLQKAIKA